ncbi:hypothetical protein Nepgr_002960 [Nepenthes gracilis]|uniref:Uncharacterized protein n=1 Tax=Nepenthes gracilis TaxID=150966 RepID=A0AAD3RYM5_NEPGR|nr:hypothetical protein Nepgr_002960 [Nepenthes gracilis]
MTQSKRALLLFFLLISAVLLFSGCNNLLPGERMTKRVDIEDMKSTMAGKKGKRDRKLSMALERKLSAQIVTAPPPPPQTASSPGWV